MQSAKRKNTATSDQVNSPKSPLTSESREISVYLLLDPELPAREIFDEVKLQELILSIKQFGIIEPLIVFPDGERYRVAAGHRRLIASRALELATVPCRVYPNGASVAEALKHHENKIREDLNAADEARHFERLLDSQCDGDVDELVKLVGETRGYVEERLLLIKGDPRIFEALKDNVIGIGVARELNLVKDSSRRMMYLDAAMRGGASISMVRQWRMQGNAQDEQFPNGVALSAPLETTGLVKPQGTQPVCIFCTSDEDQWEMEIMFVHRSCVRREERARRAEDAATPTT